MNNDENYLKINEYYNKFNEDKRLTRRHGLVEFVSSLFVINKYLDNSDKILDLGCGTGRYAFLLGILGYDIVCVEYSKANYKVLEKNLNCYNNKKIYELFSKEDLSLISKILFNNENKISDKLCDNHFGKIEVYNLDARNLIKIKNKEFDKIIMFGPMYHLCGLENKIMAINEAKKYLNDDGVMFISYILNDYAVLYHGFIEGYFKKVENDLDENYHIKDDEENLYSYTNLDDINRLNKICDLTSIDRFSQEGPSDYIRKVLNKMDDNLFEEFIKWHLSNMFKEELLGAGTHIVNCVKKTRKKH